MEGISEGTIRWAVHQRVCGEMGIKNWNDRCHLGDLCVIDIILKWILNLKCEYGLNSAV
jgi:hypothetical protein